MKPAHLTIILVAVSAFLAPLLGGQINVETIPMLDGLKFINPPEIPFLSHAILALPAVIALCYIVAKRKIIQVPSTTLSILWVGYVGLVVVSLLFSKFRSASVPHCVARPPMSNQSPPHRSTAQTALPTD